MLSKIKNNQAVLFLLKSAGLYVVWFILYDLFLHPESKVDYLLINNLTDICVWVLKSVGYTMMQVPADADVMGVVGIDGSNGVLIGYPCNGLELFALFTGFVIAFPGKIKNKFWFIPLGILVIHLTNIIRILALAIIAYKSPNYLEFNHNYTFTVSVYVIVFALWMIWTLYFSDIKSINKNASKS